MERKLPSAAPVIVALICIILGAGSFFAARLKLTEWNDFKTDAQQTTAVITDIKTKRTTTGTGKNRRHKTTHTVYVNYTVDGQTYSTTLDYYESSMRKGATRPIYYDPKDPSNSMSDPTKTVILIGVLGGLFFFIYATIGG